MFKFIFLSFLCILSACDESPDVVIKMYEEKAIGDKNQIIGVVNSLQKHKKNIEVVDFPFNEHSDLSKLIDEITYLASSSVKKIIVIGVGKSAFTVFQQLSTNTNSYFQTVALGHQWTPVYNDLIDKVDLIAVPDYAIKNPIKINSKTSIIGTNGVSHALTPESLLAEYDKYKERLLLTSQDRVIILGGDAPNTENQIQNFTEADAENLAKALIKDSSSGVFYITNGPRTGMHDLKNGTHKDNKIDKVTKKFIRALKNMGITDDNIKLFNFQFGEKSMYLPLIGAAYFAKSTVWVPGESSSMICEVISNIPPEKVMIYYNRAMNETHISHVKSVYNQGRSRCYRNDSIYPLATENVITLPDANEQIAQAIILNRK